MLKAISIKFPEEMLETIKQEAQRTGISCGAYIKNAVARQMDCNQIDGKRENPSHSVRSPIAKNPTIEEVTEYFAEKGGDKDDGERFWNYYESKGWMVGKNRMVSWRMAAANWLKKSHEMHETNLPKRQRWKTTSNPSDYAMGVKPDGSIDWPPQQPIGR